MTPRPTTGTGAGFSLRAYVSPNPVPYGAHPTLCARTAAGAVCSAALLETTHLVAEEAGATATAAAMKLHAELTGLRVVLPITGGNATAAQLLEALRT
jgi:hypothetical protein